MTTVSKRSKAGAYAWRRHQRALLPWVAVAFALMLGYVAFLLAFVVPGEASLGLMVLVGVLILGLLWFIDKRTDAINATLGEGARGEFRVGEELERLHKEGFHVFHDWYREGKGNVDHFVVGPQGAFAIETKAWGGEITCENDKLLVNGRPVMGKDPLGQARAEAAAVKELIQTSSSVSGYVIPILCFSQAQVSCYRPVASVEVLSRGALNRAIVGRGKRYSPEEVRGISYLLEKKLGIGPAAKPGLPPEEPGRLQRILTPASVALALYILSLLILSVIFAGAVATLFGWLAGFYRSLEQVQNALF